MEGRPGLAGADPHHRAHVGHPHLAVTDLPGGGGVDDGLDRSVRGLLVDDDVEADLRHQVDLVLGASVDLHVPTLATDALHLLDGHPGDARRLQRLLDVVDLVGLDDGSDQLHHDPP
jgi:hypothetical protein